MTRLSDLHVLPHVGLHYLLRGPLELLAAVPDVVLHALDVIVLGQAVLVPVLVFLHVTRLLYRILWAKITLRNLVVVSFPSLVDNQLFTMQMFMVARMFVRVRLQFDKEVMRDVGISPSIHWYIPGHAHHHGHARDCVCDCDGAHVCGCGDPEKRKFKKIANKTKYFGLGLSYAMGSMLKSCARRSRSECIHSIKPNQV